VRVSTFVNYALYQVGWFACVLSVAADRPWLGVGLGMTTLAAHLALAVRWQDEVQLALIVGALGLAVDAAQIAMGTLSFDRGILVTWLPPPWLVVTWMQFAATLRFTSAWLIGSVARAAVTGAIAGPVAFAAGARLGVVTLHDAVWPSLLSLALLWSVAIPAAILAARRHLSRPGAGRYRFLWTSTSS
jgi:hypothetical protein